MTKPEWKIILVVSLAHLIASCSFVFPFSYSPAMIKHFGYGENKLGYYVGLLGTARFVGSIFGSLSFGILSDKFGRRPTMLVTLACQVVLNLAFGFSVNFWMAFSIRLLTGLLGGITPICKTIMYEISDSTNQSIGMSVVNAAYAIGIIFGSLIGGPLAQPIVQYPGAFVDEGLLKLFPFCLPSFVVGAMCLLGFISNFIFLRETREPPKRETTEKSANPDASFGEEAPMLYANGDGRAQDNKLFFSLQHLPREENKAGVRKRCDSENARASRTDLSSLSLSFVELVKSGGSRMYLEPRDARQAEDAEEDTDTQSVTEKEEELMNALGIFLYCWRSRKLRGSIMVYALYSGFILICLEETTVLFFTEQPINGIGFMPKDIAILNGIYSAIMIPAIAILPLLEKKFGILRIHIWMLLPSLLSILFTPCVRFLHYNRVLLWAGLLISGFPIRLCLLCIITCQNIFINNSVPKSLAGSINGMSTVVTYLLRAVGAVAGPSLFQLTLVANLPYPIDLNLVFHACGLLVLLVAVITYKLPFSIQNPLE